MPLFLTTNMAAVTSRANQQYVARGALVCLLSSHEQMTRYVEYARERLHFSDALCLLLHFAVSCVQLARFLYHSHHK